MEASARRRIAASGNTADAASEQHVYLVVDGHAPARPERPAAIEAAPVTTGRPACRPPGSSSRRRDGRRPQVAHLAPSAIPAMKKEAHGDHGGEAGPRATSSDSRPAAAAAGAGGKWRELRRGPSPPNGRALAPSLDRGLAGETGPEARRGDRRRGARSAPDDGRGAHRGRWPGSRLEGPAVEPSVRGGGALQGVGPAGVRADGGLGEAARGRRRGASRSARGGTGRDEGVHPFLTTAAGRATCRRHRRSAPRSRDRA